MEIGLATKLFWALPESYFVPRLVVGVTHMIFVDIPTWLTGFCCCIGAGKCFVDRFCCCCCCCCCVKMKNVDRKFESTLGEKGGAGRLGMLSQLTHYLGTPKFYIMEFQIWGFPDKAATPLQYQNLSFQRDSYLNLFIKTSPKKFT